MNIHRQLLLSSSFTLLFATSLWLPSAFAQSSATATASASATVVAGAGATVHPQCGPKCDSTMHAEMKPSMEFFRRQIGALTPEERTDLESGGPEKLFLNSTWMDHHPYLTKAFKFINDEQFRSTFEAKMTADDKQTIENAVADAKTNIASMKVLRPQFKSARETRDSAAMYGVFKNARPNFEQLRNDHRIVRAILAKYKIGPGANGTPTGSLTEPVYPNPVHVGGTPATITYHVDQAGPVNVIVTDASGNIVQQFSENADAPGSHTLTLNSNLPRVGTYYVTVTAAGQKSTQKVEAVQ